MSTENSYSSAAEHQPFLEEFKALVAKHPQSARRFALADLDQDLDPIVTSIPVVIFECTKNADGAVFCRRVREQ